MKNFKKLGGGYIDDLGHYIREYVKESKITSPNGIRIYVGCDSENTKNHTRYATVVLVYHIGAGAHFIYFLEKTPRLKGTDHTKNLFNKLWGEVERSFLVAEYLETELEGVYDRINPNEKLVDVDLDLNPNPRWRSNIAFDAGVGYMKANGYRVQVKPKAWASSTAADLVCRNKKKKNKKY